MLNRMVVGSFLVIASITSAQAQNTNSSQTVRPRTATTNTNKPATEPVQSTDVQKPATTPPAARRTQPKPKVAATPAPVAGSVSDTFNELLNGIRKADVDAVTSIYWNSPRLILFNSNGTVTKGWEQMRRNRESSYKDVKDVKLEVRDVSISMLGRDGAVVSCLWTQSQTFKGAPDAASGRMTLVFKRVGKEWKVIHLHTSDPARAVSADKPTATSTPQ
ncbi:MAG TPA: AtzH-like domain-containing protein [Pyrinomonadaceae bacterium]|nr:AtzH-like domain-containing protein [Pyrinomonadaceae bacterium]